MEVGVGAEGGRSDYHVFFIRTLTYSNYVKEVMTTHVPFINYTLYCSNHFVGGRWYSL